MCKSQTCFFPLFHTVTVLKGLFSYHEIDQVQFAIVTWWESMIPDDVSLLIIKYQCTVFPLSPQIWDTIKHIMKPASLSHIGAYLYHISWSRTFINPVDSLIQSHCYFVIWNIPGVLLWMWQFLVCNYFHSLLSIWRHTNSFLLGIYKLTSIRLKTS